MKKLILLLFTILAPVILTASETFQPGVAAGKILGNPSVTALMDRGWHFILIIFAFVLAKNMFTFVTGGGTPNWFLIIGKFMIIFFLYNHAIFVVTTFTNEVVVATVISDSDRLSKSFSDLDVALVTLAMGDPDELQKAKDAAKVGPLPDAVTDTFVEMGRLFSFQMLLTVVFSVVMKGLLTVSLITKMLMIDIFWPIFFQLVVVGFVFAVPFAALDGGMDSLKKFAINVIEVAMWPVIYNIAFGLTTGSMIDTIEKFVKIVNNPVTETLKNANGATAGVVPGLAAASASAQVLSNLPLIALLAAHLLFLVGLGFLVPLFARMIVRNESVGIAASALTYSTGQQLMGLAKGAGGMAGMAAMSAGKGLMGMTAKGAAEMGSGAASSAGSAISSGGSSGASSPSPSGGSSGGGSSGGGGSSDSSSGKGSKITGDLAGSGGSGGRSAHGGKGFYNVPNLTKPENQALGKLSGNSDAKAEFGKLQGMRKDGYNPKAINNQIESINRQFGTDLPKEKE